jgi:NitT/TauT family transport system substrate-binding protein
MPGYPRCLKTTNKLDKRAARRLSMKRSEAVLLVGSGVVAPLAAGAQSLTSMAVAAVPEESVTPVLWAQQSGIFRRIGLSVDVVSERSGTAISAGVAGGAYQIGKSSIVPLIIAHSKGIPFVIVAPGGLYRSARPHIAMIGRRDSPIKVAADMNGKTIGVSALDDLYTISIKDWIDKNGGDSTTLKIVEMPTSAVMAALEARRIDAGGTSTPQLQEALDTGNVKVLAYMFDSIAPQFMYSGWFTTADYLKDNGKLIAGFARAESEAAAYVNGHAQETVSLLAKFSSINPDAIAKMVRASMGTTLDPKLLQPVIDVCAHYKVIPASFSAREMLASDQKQRS